MLIESAFFSLPRALSNAAPINNANDLILIFLDLLNEERNRWQIENEPGEIPIDVETDEDRSLGLFLKLDFKNIGPFGDNLLAYGFRKQNAISVKLDSGPESNLQEVLWDLLAVIGAWGRQIQMPGRPDTHYILLVTRRRLNQFEGRAAYLGRKAGTGIIEDLSRAILERKGNNIGPVYLDGSCENPHAQSLLMRWCGGSLNMTIKGKCWEFSSDRGEWNGYLIRLDEISVCEERASE